MHQFPSSRDLQFLVGAALEQVCLDPWSTQFHFAGGMRLTVEGSFEYYDAAGVQHVHQSGDERDLGPVHLRTLLSQRITAAEADPLCLALTFGDGTTLRIHSDEGPWECGQISTPGGQLIVF